jgi:hypothetical protein
MRAGILYPSDLTSAANCWITSLPGDWSECGVLFVSCVGGLPEGGWVGIDGATHLAPSYSVTLTDNTNLL